MYEGYFKLHGRPFLAAPQTSRYFPATAIENARKTLSRCIDRGEGAGLIIGPSGTGKTLLCEMLAEEFEGLFATALLTGGGLDTRTALLQAILYDLALPVRGLDEGELRLSLLDHLHPKAEGDRGLLLIIDEAHSLPLRLLEEVRMMTNFVRGGTPRVHVVLSGSAMLEERFASPKLASFAQRLAARCYLESLDAAETADYVRAQVRSVGGDAAQLFHEDALRAVYRATDGIPRLVNQVCDQALILASLAGIRRLTSDVVEEAWADLQQLPSPWSNAPRKNTDNSQVIEFGSLSDAPEDLPEAIPIRSKSETLHVAQPDEQLERMAAQLSQIDEEFEPAGMIGTEVDLDFPEFGDPFGEAFAEEEIVLDRFASDTELFASLPRVSSVEGRQLSSMLEPLSYGTGRSTAEQPWTFTYAAPPVEQPSEELILEPLVPLAGSASPLTAQLSPMTVTDIAIEPLPSPAKSPHVQTAEAPLFAFSNKPSASKVMDGIIVIDDGNPPPPLVTRPPKHTAQFRQLFSKLRRD